MIVFTGAMMTHGKVTYTQTYSATKVLVDYLNHGLSYELKQYKIDVTTIRAAGVATKIIGNKGGTSNPLMTDPDTCMKHVYSKCTAGVQHGWFNHEVLGTFVDNVCDLWPGFGDFIFSKLGEKKHLEHKAMVQAQANK